MNGWPVMAGAGIAQSINPSTVIHNYPDYGFNVKTRLKRAASAYWRRLLWVHKKGDTINASRD